MNTRLIALFPALSALVAAGAASAEGCSVQAPPTAQTLVELYTSEGCSSCPPADRWLATVGTRADVVPVAFHVSYWDHLGWRDRFGSAAFSQRQERQRAVNGAPYAYTPQVVVDGRDRPDWSRGLPASPARPVPLALRLSREGAAVAATVETGAGAPALLAGWWAVTEDGHASDVRAGENAGERLRHAAVVRQWREVAPWTTKTGRAVRLVFEPQVPAEVSRPRHVVFVVTDAATGRPVQALRLGC
jgi:hypothetical protein